MKQSVFGITAVRKLADNTFETVLSGDVSEIRPGQFVDVALPEKFLRRPISVCDARDGKLTIVYKTVGAGTKQLSEMQVGQKLDLLTGLGNGYDLSLSGDRPLLVGGGVGVPPLYMLCRELIRQGKSPTVLLGFNTKSEVFYEREFLNLGAEVSVATADGSYGTKGFVTGLMQGKDYTYFYSCGPMPMLEAVSRAATSEGELSFEERMGCGFGACMGCTCETLTGNKRICKDGPVMKRSEIKWPTRE
ncbi:MAG: dihydroorotate dehydrogenase electron transfer subunit [Clostridia bacterium]|nr:dihydroorotate dehydrogenase electron transfer subunit [Clostridia bacterium]